MSLTRKDMIKSIAAENKEVTRDQVELVLKAAEEKMVEAFKAGENVTLVGFGTFKATPTEKRTGHNPRTGEAVEIPASIRVTFSVADNVKDQFKA